MLYIELHEIQIKDSDVINASTVIKLFSQNFHYILIHSFRVVSDEHILKLFQIKNHLFTKITNIY